MPASYKYTDKDGNPILLSRINEEMYEYFGKGGDVESWVSYAGIMLLMHTGGFTLSEKQIRDICAEKEIDENTMNAFIEFFVRRYTFESWR